MTTTNPAQAVRSHKIGKLLLIVLFAPVEVIGLAIVGAWVYGRDGVLNVRSAWSRALATSAITHSPSSLFRCIKNPPPDKENVLLWWEDNPGEWFCITGWFDAENNRYKSYDDFPHPFEYWQPLPAPPTTKPQA